MNVVLFLGAGFSARFGLPVMGEFFDHAYQSGFLTDDEKKRLEKLQRGWRGATNIISGNEKNLEDVLSYTEMRADFASEDAEETSKAIRQILAKVYCQFDAVKYDEIVQRDFRKLLCISNSVRDWDHVLTVITTNYDMLADWALHRVGLDPDLCLDGASFASESSGTPMYFKPGHYGEAVKLCKLHGSINWFLPKEDGPLEIDDRWELIQTAKGQLVIPRACNTSHFERDVPFLIPPTFVKRRGRDMMFDCWKAAHHALSTADLLAFIGYSFPASDTYMRFFLASALADNVHLGRILVLDPMAASIVENKLRPVENYGPAFRDIVEARPGSWTDHKLPL